LPGSLPLSRRSEQSTVASLAPAGGTPTATRAAPAWMRSSPRRKRFIGLDSAPAASCGRRPLRVGELGVGVVKDGVDLKAPAEGVDVALEGREAHVDLPSRCAPGVSDDDGNRGRFVSNKPRTLISTGLSVSNSKYARVQVPNRVPVDRLPDTVREAVNRATMRDSEWRDPDSNRGHHDFQTDAPNTRTGREMPANTRVPSEYTERRGVAQLARGRSPD
jgi:hypothetical protein